MKAEGTVGAPTSFYYDFLFPAMLCLTEFRVSLSVFGYFDHWCRNFARFKQSAQIYPWFCLWPTARGQKITF
jgi:hypothetical protein